MKTRIAVMVAMILLAPPALYAGLVVGTVLADGSNWSGRPGMIGEDRAAAKQAAADAMSRGPNTGPWVTPSTMYNNGFWGGVWGAITDFIGGLFSSPVNWDNSDTAAPRG
jgi:hypothetical protein